MFLSGIAALFAYTVVITSRPTAVAAARAPKRAPAVDQSPAQVLPGVPSLPDPRQRILRIGR